MLLTQTEMKQKVCDVIDGRKEYLISLGNQLLQNPELGFKEYYTADLATKELEKLGLNVQTELAITGFKAKVGNSSQGPTIGVIGELDAIRVYGHPLANEKTGAAHACGHNAQIVSMIGVASGLIESGIIDNLAGNVAFIGTPAEEFIELDFRKQLREEGKIEFLGGKQELIRLGAFDEVDLAMMVHAGRKGVYSTILGVGGSGSAFIAKIVRYFGKASHAGVAPDRGINALNAAMLGLLNIHVQRETFRDNDTVRVHPIITHGGDTINVVPDNVRVETYVRAGTVNALLEANKKIDRALKAGAMATGAQVEIENIPGYLSVLQNQDLAAIFGQNAIELVGEEYYYQAPPGKTGGFGGDIGDLFNLIPGIMGSASGWTGNFHAPDFRVIDEEVAYILPAKVMAMTVVDLLFGNAEAASSIIEKHKPILSKHEYIELIRGFFQKIHYIPDEFSE